MWLCVNGGVISTHGDVEDGDYVEGRGEDGAHAFDGWLVQAVVGRQHLPVRDQQQPPPERKQCSAWRITDNHTGSVVVHSCAV